MKNHLLDKFKNKGPLGKNDDFFYDYRTQISYNDETLKEKVVELSIGRGTFESRAIENSDPDILLNRRGTGITESIEDSDRDEIYVKRGTIDTYTTEVTDRDEILLFT